MAKSVSPAFSANWRAVDPSRSASVKLEPAATNMQQTARCLAVAALCKAVCPLEIIKNQFSNISRHDEARFWEETRVSIRAICWSLGQLHWNFNFLLMYCHCDQLLVDRGLQTTNSFHRNNFQLKRTLMDRFESFVDCAS